MDKFISTEHLPVDQRFDFWREEVTKRHLMYEVTRTDTDTPFRAECHSSVLEDIIFSFAQQSGLEGSRSASHIATDILDHYVLAIPIHESAVMQDGIEYLLQDNEMVLFDGTRPLWYQHGDNRGGITIAIPRHLLESRLQESEIMGPRVASLDIGVGPLVRSFCQTLPEVMKSGPAAEVRSVLARQLTDLLALAFQASEEGAYQSRETLAQARFQAIKNYIDTHIHDYTLSPESIIREMGISRSYLYKLFAQQDFVFQDYLRTRRLARVATDLRNPALQSQSITDIAVANGFSNMSHFSRIFRQHFGESPRAYRARMAG